MSELKVHYDSKDGKIKINKDIVYDKIKELFYSGNQMNINFDALFKSLESISSLKTDEQEEIFNLLNFSPKDKFFASFTMSRLSEEPDTKTLQETMQAMIKKNSIDSLGITIKDTMTFFKYINPLSIRRSVVSLASDHKIEITTDFKLKALW